MKLEVGMYVRTKEGYICKILKLNEPFEDDGYLDHNDIGSASIQEKNVIKASHNIIDLIEKNDFVNGHRVIQVDRESLELDIENSMYGCGCETINGDRDIKSIVTKEQFESMSYKVEDL